MAKQFVIRTEEGYLGPEFDLTSSHECVEGLRRMDVSKEAAEYFPTQPQALLVVGQLLKIFPRMNFAIEPIETK